MADDRTGAPNEGSRGRGRFGPWPWLAAIALVLGGLSAIDVAFYWDDRYDYPDEQVEGEGGPTGFDDDDQDGQDD
jgi:hypothetical protein